MIILTDQVVLKIQKGLYQKGHQNEQESQQYITSVVPHPAYPFHIYL